MNFYVLIFISENFLQRNLSIRKVLSLLILSVSFNTVQLNLQARVSLIKDHISAVESDLETLKVLLILTVL